MVFLELRRDSRVTTGNSGCLLCWPRQVQSSIRVAKERWALLSSDCRGKQHPPTHTISLLPKNLSLFGPCPLSQYLPQSMLLLSLSSRHDPFSSPFIHSHCLYYQPTSEMNLESLSSALTFLQSFGCSVQINTGN